MSTEADKAHENAEGNLEMVGRLWARQRVDDPALQIYALAAIAHALLAIDARLASIIEGGTTGYLAVKTYEGR